MATSAAADADAPGAAGHERAADSATTADDAADSGTTADDTDHSEPTSGDTAGGRHRLNVALVLNRVGRALIGAGVIILLFVAYQLWGTNIQEQRSQDRLQSSFSDTLAKLETVDPSVLAALRGQQPTASTQPGAPPTTQPGAPPTIPTTVPRDVFDLIAPQEGEPVAVIRIPSIGVERRVVEGTAVDDLRQGPGHYAETPLPGQAGNAAIAGHRTTYGAPFNHIDELVPGDEIEIQTVQGTAIYRVDQDPFVVSPDQTEVLDDNGDNRLTLTSCHPKLSSAKRMIVTAKLETPPFPALPSGDVASVAADVASTTTVAEGVADPDAPGPVVTVTTTAGLPDATETSTTAVGQPPTTAPAIPGDEAAQLGADQAGQPDLDQGLAGDRSALPSAIGWALVTAALAIGVWLLARLADHRLRMPPRGRRLAVYVLASPVLLFFLFLCFENVDRLLPAY
jgi:sortase A